MSGGCSVITGIGGFAGPHLTAELLGRGRRVAGIVAPETDPRIPGLEASVRVEALDIRNRDRLSERFRQLRPSTVYHLAALSHVGASWQQRHDTLDVNVLGTDAVLAAALSVEPPPTVLVVSTGQVYGAAPPETMPLGEEAPTRPVSPYAASKLCAEVLALQVHAASGLPVVVVRPFNFTGPGQAPDFVCSDFARQVAWAEAGRGPDRIVVGNLEARRDFTDVRDMVAGFARAAERGRPGGIYNLASGTAVPIADVLDRLIELGEVQIEVRQDPERLRPADIPVFVGDAGRAREELGWRPERPLAETLRDTLDHWRAVARRAGPDADA